MFTLKRGRVVMDVWASSTRAPELPGRGSMSTAQGRPQPWEKEPARALKDHKEARPAARGWFPHPRTGGQADDLQSLRGFQT